ncbi:MAG: hypothetical protein GDA48_10850 [Hormoscilla sp. GM102CHS1]|nr:hypothetical protein [Hormoscilla sp. GM102CHS1]
MEPHSRKTSFQFQSELRSQWCGDELEQRVLSEIGLSAIDDLSTHFRQKKPGFQIEVLEQPV